MDPEEDPVDEEETVLSPQELKLTEKEGVEQLEEGRFVVSPDGSSPEVPSELTPRQDDQRPTDAEVGGAGGESSGLRNADTEQFGDAGRSSLDRSTIQDWHTRELSESPSYYGYHLSLKAGDVVDHHTLHSDDVTMAFNNLLLWYARTVDADLPPGAVIGILLSDASVPVQFPTKTLEQFLLNRGLSTDDSIGDLLETVREDGGVVFPPRTE